MVQGLARQHGLYPVAAQFLREVLHEAEDARVHVVVLPERLQVPTDEHQVAPGGLQVAGIRLGVERESGPGLVAEAVSHVVRQFVVAAEQTQCAPGVTVEMRGFAPLQHPRSTVEHGALVSSLGQGEVDLVVHHHLGGIRDADLFPEVLLRIELPA